MKKPSGLSVARGTPADDGGGHLAPSRVEAKNGNSLSHSASTAGSSASNRTVASNGRGSSSNSSSSLLLRRRRLKRNLSAAAAATTTTTSTAASAVTAACGAKMNSALSSASLHTRSLDRKTLLKHRQNMQLQSADREWVRADLHRGSIHVHDRLTPSYPRPVLCTMDTTAGEVAPTLYVQLHGEAVRRLSPDERPLQIQNDFLFKLGFKDPWRVQEEGLNTEIGSLLRFYAGKPQSIESSERVQLSGTYNVRKGKLQLPVNRWTRRQVILCGTCLIVSSVKESQTGKMHILPLIGGKVEEVKKHNHCLAFSSAGPQSQTYYVSFDSFTEHLRWHRHAAKMVSQRINSVDLSCCSLEQLPPNLFYSHDLTHLNLKHNFLPADQRFSRLRSLNLSNNHLGQFPLAICDIPTLTEVNLSCNYLASVPSSVGAMTNLQTFLLDGNSLDELPNELGSLQRLSYLGLSFNQFSHVPQVLERLASMEKLCMAGNNLETLILQNFRLLRVKHIDLRLNKISSMVPDEPDLLRHVTQLDVRDNRLTDLDASVFPRLEVLHCERNRIAGLKAKGCLLKGIYASNNELRQLDVSPVPSNLSYMDVSRNHMESLPDWLCEAKKLEVLDVSHNLIAELPARLLCSNSLRKLSAGHNQLQKLPERVERPLLEVLDVQHNQLVELPCNLFLKSDSLRCVNVSANKLEHLPPSSLSEESHSILQELYLTNNRLTDKCVPMLTGHSHLRVLHMAYNHLQTFPASKMAKLEELEEVDLSGNMLKTVPTTIMNCRRMHTLIAHSNAIEVFPEVMQLMEMKCVDLSCNELSEITLPENLPPKLQELDLTGNPRLNLDHKTLDNIRCFRIDPPPTFSSNEASGGPAVWSHGYTEASGVKNKLCVAALSVNSFCGSREALYGVFDGDRNVEVPYLLQCTMNDVLAEELHKTKSEEDYMTNTFLVMQRKLGTAGQKLGGSAALCHIRHDPTDPGGCFTLTAANVGKCQAILCRDGKPLSLSLLHNVGLEDEYRRIRQHRAIITEDNKVNGVTDSTRIMGYSFLYPSVIPCPYVQTVTLSPQDEFFILGSRGLWDAVSPTEAVEAVRNVPDGLAAAKKLCTLAQGYGCTDSLSAVVVQLSVSEDCCSCCCSEPPQPPPSPGLGPYPPSSSAIKERPSDGSLPVPPSSCSEISSEISTSEMSSEVGSTASSDEPPQSSLLPSARSCCALHPACLASSFQRQLSSATFSSALSDNGLDSEDEEPIAGVFSNGSRVEVEADVHCLKAESNPTDSSPTTSTTMHTRSWQGVGAGGGDGGKLAGKRRINGSVARQEKSHNLIEVAADAPSKKSGGYFTAPAQPDPDDQFIIPPELEEEVKEIMKQHQQKQQKPPGTDQPTDYYDTPL
uniref:protein-serine/threonine phosphatase n=1 Tax=Lates calcarifer TaxID=8187 RepID=A0A4W6D6G5_LATCA